MCNEEEPFYPPLILELSLLPFSIFHLPVYNFPSFLHFPLFHFPCLFSQWVSRNFPVRSLWWAFYRRPPPASYATVTNPLSSVKPQVSSFQNQKVKNYLHSYMFIGVQERDVFVGGCLWGWTRLLITPPPF